MAHDASHNPNLSGADPQDRPAGGDARFGAKTILLLVFGVLLVALGHPTKGPELARILGRFRKRHLDLIVGRVMDGIRLAEELERQDAERRAAEAQAAADDVEVAEAPSMAVAERRGEVVWLSAHRRHGFAPRSTVRRNAFGFHASRGPPPLGFALAA